MFIPTSPINAADQCAKSEESFWRFATDIAQREGTPFYVYLPQCAAEAYKVFASSIQCWGEGQIAFSLKTNPLWRLLRDLRKCGAYAEVVSTWEFSHALAAGFSPENIVFNGPLKTEKDFRCLCQHPPLTINIDSLDELDAIERAVGHTGSHLCVGLRLCPPKENGAWSRFGIELSTGELDEAIVRILRTSSLDLRCVHFHLGTQIQDTARYTEMIGIVKDLWTQHRLGRDVWLDIGGGFPYDHLVPFEEQTFSPSNLLASLADAWGPPPRPRLLAEPGRFIAAPAMAIVSRVLACKPRLGEPTVVVLDSGTNHNVMAAFYEHLWSCPETTAQASHRFCGPLCMEDDILSGERLSPVPKTGSLVASFNAGAYSVALSRAFIQPRPSIFALRSDGGDELIQRREVLGKSYPLAQPAPLATHKSGSQETF
jgi:diaminopimelate decarboxylase